MGFCIMRVAKIKSTRDLVFSLEHNNRDRVPLNADPEKIKENWTYSLGGKERAGTPDVLELFDELKPEKIRKNAVVAVEVVMTASPEFSGNWDKYLNACDGWAMGLFGAENLLHIAHHRDEKTPHTHITFIPKKDGKLNAKHFIGGHRDKMIQLQNDFYEKVGKAFGLERGQSKSETKKRHSHHTLSGEISKVREHGARLDNREAKLSEREAKLNAAAGEFKQLMGMKPADVQKLKTLVGNWDKTNPTGLRNIANDIERSGAKTVGEYRKARELERQQAQTRKI